MSACMKTALRLVLPSTVYPDSPPLSFASSLHCFTLLEFYYRYIVFACAVCAVLTRLPENLVASEACSCDECTLSHVGWTETRE